MQEMKSNRSDQTVLETPLSNDLFYLKLQWVSAKDVGLKRSLSEKIRTLLRSTT